MITTVATTTPAATWRETFVEEFGLLAEAGLPRSVARVLGWLVVCEPRYQSAEQLRTTLRLSNGSVSSAVSMLARAGFASRVSFPGDRRIYYQLQSEGWQRLLRDRVHVLGQARAVAEQALDASGDPAHARLREMRDVYGWLESTLTRLVEEYPKAARTAPRVRARHPVAEPGPFKFRRQ